MVNYLREYIPNFASIAEPLTRLLKKETPFHWSDDQNKAFNHFKELLVSQPVRHIFNPDLECELHTDASTVGIASILIQNGHPIGYHSRKLSDAETRYTVTEQECLALVESVSHFRIYLSGKKFKVYTDHIALKWLLNFDSTKKRLYRWSQELSNYDFEVIHRAGKHMVHVDALSRAPVCHVISDDDLLCAQRQDLKSNQKYIPEFHSMANVNQTAITLESRPYVVNKESTVSSITYNGRRLRHVPPSMVSDVLNECHDLAGHPGVKKTTKQIRCLYFWPKMSIDIRTYVQSCHSCQINKLANHRTFGQLQPLPTPDQPLSLLSTDTVVIGSSAEKTSAKYLQVTLDHHTRYVWAKTTKSNTSEAIISTLDSIFKSVGLPERLLTDNATNYRSRRLKTFLTKLKIKRSFTTSFHPQTNGSNEKANDTIVKGIRLELVSHPTYKWSTLVQRVVENYNNTIHSTTGFTPAYLMFGKDRIGTSSPSLAEARSQAKQRSDDFKLKKKKEFDLKHKSLVLSNGDLVKRRIPANHPKLQKLSPRFEAPFKVLSTEGPVNAVIQRLKAQLNGSLVSIADPIRIHVCQLEPYFYRTRLSEGESVENAYN